MAYIGTTHLLIEISLNLVLAALSVALILRAQDNRLRLTWGLLGMTLALSMLLDNVLWLRIDPVDVLSSLTLLNIPLMIKWYLFVHALSLFTVGSLRPEWISFPRIVTLSLPPIIACTVAACYLWFDGSITPLYTAAGIPVHIGQIDVQVRLGLFLLSVLTPALTLSAQLFYRTPLRRHSRGMWIYILCIALMITSYILFLLAFNWRAIYAFGYVVAILPIGLSILYLLDENPLSLRRNMADIPPETAEIPLSTITDLTAYKLYVRIEEHMQTNTSFADADYSLRQLSQDICASCTLTTRAIKSGGFTGFHEWVNFLRLEHFKELADRQPGATIKELMFRCGFTSRSSFYRHFAEQEAMSPKEYLERRLRAGGGSSNE